MNAEKSDQTEKHQLDEFCTEETQVADEIISISMKKFASASRHQFFEGAGRGQILDILPLLKLENKNCVLIEAEQGFGKTSLAHQVYVQTLEQEHHACMIHGSELGMDDDQQLRDCLSQHLKLPQSYETVESLCSAYSQSESKPLVLVIDDAQQLCAAGISLLLGFIQNGPKEVQLVVFSLAGAPVLLADSTFQDYLNEHGHCVALKPLNSRETAEYVRFLLIASERENVKLSRQAMSRIFQTSSGVPAKINEALVYALQEFDQKPVEQQNNQRSEIVPKWHLISLSLVAFGVIALILFGNPEPSGERFSDTIRPMPEAPEPAFKSPAIQFTDAPAPKPLAPKPAADASSEDQPEPVIKELAKAPEPAEKAPSTSDAPKQEPEASRVSMDAKIAKLRESQPEPQARSAAPAQVSAAQSPAAREASAKDDAVDWVKSMSPKHYTLQLLGGANKTAIESFVKQNGDFRKMGYFETQREGRPWYVVVYGDFPSRAKAIAAGESLPSQLKSSKPWARMAGDIQAKMSR